MKDNKKKGFTLIELLIVIGILAIIMIIVFVSVNGITKNVDDTTTTISKENILKAASNYAYEYLIDSNIWYEEKNSEDQLIGTYCVNTQMLIDYGFLPKEVKDNSVIKITKDPYSKISTQFITSKDDCDNSIPIINIDISNGKIFDEVANFTISLEPAIAGGKITYKDFYYTIYDSSDNEIIKVECGSNSNNTTCSGSFNNNQDDNYYGKYKVIGYVGKSPSNFATIEREFEIKKLEPTITFTTDGTKGNNDYYISNITVNTNTDDDSKYTKEKLCVSDSDIGTNPVSNEWNNCTKEPTNLDDNYNSKYVCARYKTNAGNKYRSKCQQYKIDTTLPTVSITSGSYSSSKVNVTTTVNGDYSDGVKYKIVDNDVNSTNACSESNFNNITSNTINTSYGSNVSKAIWLKDNAGNCKKQSSFGIGIDTTTDYIYDDSSTKTHTVNSNYNINNIIYSNSFNDKVSYAIDSTKKKIIVSDIPVFEGTETNEVDQTCSKSANSYNAYSDTVCDSYSCNYGGKVSGSKCVSNVTFNTTYTKYLVTIKNAYFFCNSLNKFTYNENSVTIKFQNTYGGGCPEGYSKYYSPSNVYYSAMYVNPRSNSYSKVLNPSGKINGHPDGASCGSDMDLYIYFPYDCDWDGNYNASCDSYSTEYYCDSDDYLSGSKCYYCSGSEYTLNRRYCKYDCSYTEEISKYSYGKYAVLFTIND